MTPAEHALARARTYSLIAEILLDGWTPRALAVVAGLPWGAGLADAPPDALAARHQQALGRGVSPHASVFTSADGLLGGAEGAWWTDWAGRAGLPAGSTHEADHAGCVARALGFLEAARSDALRDGVATRPIEILTAEALARLGWIGALAVAVRQQGVPELAEVTDLLHELVREHGAPGPTPGVAEPLLADPSTGLKDVAAYLLVPARCGLWLGPDDLRRVSRAAGVPCGFGRRIQMAESLLFSAVDHGALPALADALLAELARWDEALGADPRRQSTARMVRTLGAAREP